MLVFDDVPSGDDLAVLTAYVRVQEIAEAARKSQSQSENALSLASAPDESDAACEASSSDEAEFDADADEPRAVKTVPRRTEIWVSRLHEIEGILPDRMAPIHGRLIARGLLQFQLQGREQGVRYRVSMAGRQLLNTPGAEAA